MDRSAYILTVTILTIMILLLLAIYVITPVFYNWYPHVPSTNIIPIPQKLKDPRIYNGSIVRLINATQEERSNYPLPYLSARGSQVYLGLEMPECDLWEIESAYKGVSNIKGTTQIYLKNVCTGKYLTFDANRTALVGNKTTVILQPPGSSNRQVNSRDNIAPSLWDVNTKKYVPLYYSQDIDQVILVDRMQKWRIEKVK